MRRLVGLFAVLGFSLVANAGGRVRFVGGGQPVVYGYYQAPVVYQVPVVYQAPVVYQVQQPQAGQLYVNQLGQVFVAVPTATYNTQTNYGTNYSTTNNYGTSYSTQNNYGRSYGTVNNFGDSHQTVNNYGNGRTTVNDYGNSQTTVNRR